MARIPSRNPPQPSGTITLTTYDLSAWDDAKAVATDWHIDLGLYVEYALRKYFKGRRDRERFTRWKAERDAADPDLRRISEFLRGSDGD